MIATAEELNAKAVARIIEQAKRLANDPDLNKWRDVYEPAKKAIKEFELSADDYQRAILSLVEALGV